MKYPLNRLFIILIITFLLTILFLPESMYLTDASDKILWITSIREAGLSNTFNYSFINYFPISIYIFALFGTFFPGLEYLSMNIYKLKIFMLLFDYLTVALIAWFIKEKKYSPFYSLFILLNPAYLYNSLLWGQNESVYIFFIILAFILTLNNKPAWAIFAFVFSFFTKLQAIVFLPGLVLLLLPIFIKDKKQIFVSIGSAVLAFIIINLPFLSTLHLMFNNVLGSVDLFPHVSLNAFNIWRLIFYADSNLISDQNMFWVLSYKQWGILMFCIVSFIILFPSLVDILRIIKKKLSFSNEFIGNFFLAQAMVSFAFFELLTQMHERYLQPTIVLLGLAYIFKRGKGLLIYYISVSILFLINLEKVLMFFDPDKIILQFMPSRWVSAAMMIVFIWGILEIYRQRKFNVISS